MSRYKPREREREREREKKIKVHDRVVRFKNRLKS